MLLFGRDINEFFETVECDAPISLALRKTRYGFVMNYRDEQHVQPVKILEYDRNTVWCPQSQSLKGIVVKDDILVGLVGFTNVQAKEEGENVVVSAEPEKGSFIVILKASEKFELFKRFLETLLISFEGMRVQIPKSFIPYDQEKNVQFDKPDQIALLKTTDQNLAQKLLQRGLQVAIEAESEEEVESFYRLGVRYFHLKDYNKNLCRKFPDCCFVIKHGTLIESLRFAHGIVFDAEGLSLEDIILSSMLNRLLVLYVKVFPTWTRLLDILGFGALGWIRSINPLFTRIEKLNESSYRILFIDETNLPSVAILNTLNGEIEWIQSSRRVKVVRNTKLNDDGRRFHFYVEGESECSS
ncbi:hypothetical protein [Pseudothermotoga sp.]|nr:hypothetical protein [Pseudothermotoga sp.]MCX7813471.1 hypothetical protein [Pseudothermotoga sp.]MDW8139541.1 hypothetical protein [Pseudothermotoga sp.]